MVVVSDLFPDNCCIFIQWSFIGFEVFDEDFLGVEVSDDGGCCCCCVVGWLELLLVLVLLLLLLLLPEDCP